MPEERFWEHYCGMGGGTSKEKILPAKKDHYDYELTPYVLGERFLPGLHWYRLHFLSFTSLTREQRTRLAIRGEVPQEGAQHQRF